MTWVVSLPVDGAGGGAFLRSAPLRRLLRGFPGEVSVVCIGPLNNLAEALQQHPDLPELVLDLVRRGSAHLGVWAVCGGESRRTGW